MLKRKSLNAPFKPPLKVKKDDQIELSATETEKTSLKSKNSGTTTNLLPLKHSSKPKFENLNDEVEDLRNKSLSLAAEIETIEKEGYSTVCLDPFIKKLHEYNELKDIGQALFGQLALIRGETVKSLYERYGLEIDD